MDGRAQPPDAARSATDRQQAACGDSKRGGTYQLVDRGSKNFTFLDGKRLEAGRAYPLQSGDLIEIGDFEIIFEVIEKHEPTGEETVFAPSFSNPFEEPANELNEIVEAYEDEVPNRRLDGLRHAFKQAEDEGSVSVDHISDADLPDHELLAVRLRPPRTALVPEVSLVMGMQVGAEA